MIVTADELDAIAARAEGSLKQVPYAVLLLALARARRSVTLEITRKPLVKQIFIEGGVPVECHSNLAHETLSRFMESSGLIDEATATECFAESCSKGVRMGDVLIGRGIITAEELRKVLQKNLAKKLLDGFSWFQGTYRVTELPAEIDSSLKVNLPQLVIIGVTRFATRQQVDAAIGPLVGKPLSLHPSPSFSPDEIHMNPRQQAVADALGSRPQRMDELASATGIPDEELIRTLYALSLIGLVTGADELPQKKSEERPVPPSRPATTPTPPARPATAPESGRRTELMEMALNFRRRDAFELLGVDPDDFGRQAQGAFLAFAEKYAPWTYPDDLADDARRVFLAGARAFGELSDPDRRQALFERRRDRGQPQTAAAADTFRLETDLLDPAVQHRQGRALMAEGDYRDAIEQLSYASDLDPQNGTYRAELAYCRYLYNPQAGGPPALAELKKAQRIDPGCGLVHFYQGEILREMGRIDEAETAYRQAIRPMSPDRRPIEALKTLSRSRR